MNNHEEIQVIIVEGADNTGKNTFCDGLVRELINRGKDPVYIESTFDRQLNLEKWKDSMRGLKKFARYFISRMPSNYILLLNRSWLDEFVYGPIYRGYGTEDLSPLEEIGLGEQLRTCVVYLESSPEELAKREDGLSFSKGTPEIIREEQRRFEKAVGMYKQLWRMTNKGNNVYDISGRLTDKYGTETVTDLHEQFDSKEAAIEGLPKLFADYVF